MKKLLRTIKGEITSNEPLVVVLPDNVERNITFKFYLKKFASLPDYTGF